MMIFFVRWGQICRQKDRLNLNFLEIKREAYVYVAFCFYVKLKTFETTLISVNFGNKL